MTIRQYFSNDEINTLKNACKKVLSRYELFHFFCIIFWLVCLSSVPFLIYKYVVNRRPGSIVFSLTFIILVVIVLPVVEYFRFKTISKLKYVYLPGSIRHISDKYIIRIKDTCITINEETHFNWENIKFCFLLGNYLLLYMGEKSVVFIKSENDINKTICEKLDQQKINIFSLDTLAINKKLAEKTSKRQRKKYGPILIINLFLFLLSYFKMRSGV